MRASTSLFRTVYSRFYGFALVGTALLAACGGDDDNNGPSTPPDQQPSDEQTLFAMENLSSQDAYYVYIRSCGTESWGSDRLGSTRILDVGEVITWTVNNPGCYDVQARTSSTAGQTATYMGVNVAAGETTTVTIQDANWQD